jgi:hypothetical protein
LKTAVGLGIMAMVGLVVGIALFSLTSQVRLLYTYSTPICQQGANLDVDKPGFDPLTGQPHGRTFHCAGSGRAMTFSPDPELASRWAIPVPVGFVLGASAAGLVLLIDERRRRLAGGLVA